MTDCQTSHIQLLNPNSMCGPQVATIAGRRVHFACSGAVANVRVERADCGQRRRIVCPACHTELGGSTSMRTRMQLIDHERHCIDLQLWFAMGGEEFDAEERVAAAVM